MNGRPRERARYRIAAPLDIPYVVALLDLLSERSHPGPELLARLLRDGFAAAPLPVAGCSARCSMPRSASLAVTSTV